MKRVLIISPYFPPTNAADMHRVRMSLPYFEAFGWEAEVVTVDPIYSDMIKDPLLVESLPIKTKIHSVKAISKRWSTKVGLGALALRSLWFYKKKVNSLLANNKFDLVYFSTTQFPICILGPYWKRKFGIPYIIDMQDPWHTDYYKNKPKAERPSKYWFSYRLNKLLEPIAMKHVSGVISVSDNYIQVLKNRYKGLKNALTATITFGYFEKDLEISRIYSNQIKSVIHKSEETINLVYVGRGGYDIQPAVKMIFEVFKSCLNDAPELFKKFRFKFIGTSYAPEGEGVQTITPVADDCGLKELVYEQTDRVSFYESLKALDEADALIIPGSDDPSYTASKIYPYVLSKKPLLALFNNKSSAYRILKECQAGCIIDLNSEELKSKIIPFFVDVAAKNYTVITNFSLFEDYSGLEMTRKQCAFFDKVIDTI